MSNQQRFRVCPRPPFAFDLALEYLRRSPASIVEVITPDAYRRPLRLRTGGTTTALLEVRAGSDLSSLDVTLIGDGLGEDDRREAEAVVRRLFGVDDDLDNFYPAIQSDPTFSALAQECLGLRPVIIPDLFETIVWAIIGQQITVHFAAKCKRALIERFGEEVAIEGQRFRLFPRPERLATVTEGELAAIQFSRQKIRYVLGLARDIAEGRFDLADLWLDSPEEALERLQRLVGIGRWTAEYVLMRGLGHRDVIPAGDGALRRIIGSAYGLTRSATEAEVRRLAESWVGWRSYATFYWWFAVQRKR